MPQGSYFNNTLDFSNTTLINIAAIQGAAGNDIITGTSGDDVIVGGDGWDTLNGGAGDDVFRVSAGDDYDSIDGGEGTHAILEHYDYFRYVTSEPLSAWQAHRKYGERATSETWIEETKSQISMAHLKIDDFLPNAAVFQSAILAYNTLRWMALMSGNEQLRQWEPQSIRTFLIRVAGKLLTGANQLCIKLPCRHLYPRHWNDWLAMAA